MILRPCTVETIHITLKWFEYQSPRQVYLHQQQLPYDQTNQIQPTHEVSLSTGYQIQWTFLVELDPVAIETNRG